MKKIISIKVGGYIDPSSMTYILQILIGALVAIGTAVGIYWHKIKRFFRNLSEKKKAQKAEQENSSSEK